MIRPNVDDGGGNVVANEGESLARGSDGVVVVVPGFQ